MYKRSSSSVQFCDFLTPVLRTRKLYGQFPCVMQEGKPATTRQAEQSTCTTCLLVLIHTKKESQIRVIRVIRVISFILLISFIAFAYSVANSQATVPSFGCHREPQRNERSTALSACAATVPDTRDRFACFASSAATSFLVPPPHIDGSIRRLLPERQRSGRRSQSCREPREADHRAARSGIGTAPSLSTRTKKQHNTK